MSASPNQRVREYVDRLDRLRRSLADELADEVALVEALSMVERGRWVASACEDAAAIVSARRKLGTWSESQEEPAPDYAAKWQMLNARFRAARRKRT